MAEVLETTDADAAEDIVRRVYTSTRNGAGGNDLLVHISQQPFGAVTCPRTTRGVSVGFLADPVDLRLIGQLDELDAELAGLEPSLLGGVAEPAPGTLGPVRLPFDQPHSTTAAAHWWRMHDVVRRTPAEDPVDAHPSTLRRATMFMKTDTSGDITVRDIASAASVSVRALQRTFRRYPEQTTVPAVAARRGFYRLGRFIAAYRDAFGELPSQTLDR